MFKYGNSAAVRCGYHKSAHCHSSKKSRCFKNDRLTARVRSCNDKRLIVLAKLYIDRNDLIRCNKRMTSLFQIGNAVIGNCRDAASHLCAEISLSEIQIKLRTGFIIGGKRLCTVRTIARKLRNNALYLLFFTAFENFDIIVSLNDRHRFNEVCRTRRRCCVNQSRDTSLMFCLYGKNITSVTDSNNIFLQGFLNLCIAHKLVKALSDLNTSLRYLSSDIRKLMARHI